MNKEELNDLLGKTVSFLSPNSSEIEGEVIAVDFSRNAVDVKSIGEYWRNVPVKIIKVLDEGAR